MQPEIHPFYPFSPEDRLIKRAIKAGLVTQEARATPLLKERCCQYPFKLNSGCRLAILSIVIEKFEVKGRSSLHVMTSMQEISLEVQKVAKEKFDADVKTLFVGGGLLEALKPLFLDFFDHCGLKDLITTLFRTKLNAKPNDYDFQFVAQLGRIQDYKVLVDEGVVSLLARKINWEWINPNILVSQLRNSKAHADKLSQESYLKRVFEEHPEFNSKSKDLGELAVKVFNFVKAHDAAGHFYFRNIASEENSYDCFIPIGDPPKINSLCIDISQIDKEDTELYLESLLGKEMLLQAIIDANFAILYGDPNHPANELDFARTICHLSKKGRLSGIGWFAKTYTALDQAKNKRKLILSKMLSTQFISRAENHHRSPRQALIVMTFNASAILMAISPALEDEVQKLWQEIGKYIKKGRNVGPLDPLVEQIQILMCDFDCLFQDLYSQFQVSAFLSQHESREGKGTYQCRPTQSEEMLYTQIVLNFSQNCPEEKNVDICTLFFPYSLSVSIGHLQELAILNSLKPIHELLTSGSVLAVGINKSVLKKDKYRLDPRRNFSESVQVAVNLLKIKDEQTWRMGFLLTLSHLAMSDDEILLEALLKNLISMLLHNWAADEFKSEMALQMQEMLKNSDINVRAAFFQHSTSNSIIGDLLSSDKKLLKDLGWNYFKKVENKRHELLEKLYFDLIDSYLHEQKLGRNECSFLKELIKHMASSNQLSIDSALNVYIILFKNIELSQGAEEDLLEAALSCILRMKNISNVKEVLPAFIQDVLESKACKLLPHLGLCLSFEAYRLKICTNKFREAVATIHELTINEAAINPIYCSEKFDALSDFMQHYSLQSVQALKASILRRIKLEISEDFLQLLRLLTSSQGAWDERVFIFEVLTTLPVKAFDHEIEKVLELFSCSCSNRNTTELAQFYLEQLDKNEHNLCFLHPLLVLLCDETILHSDEDFVRCTEIVVRQKDLSKSNRQEISERFVHKLYHRQLWKELMCIYVAEPQILLEWTTLSVSSFIQSYYKLRQSRALHLLKTLPLNFDLSLEVKKTLILLLRDSQNECMQQGLFVEALQWAEKLKSIEGKDVFLEQCLEAIPELLFHCNKLAKEPGLYELTHQVFCWSNPEPALWIEYVKLAVTNAPTDVVEKVLDLLAHSDSGSLHLSQHSRIIFWDLVLEKLEDLGSMKFLHPLTWWPNMWKELSNEPEAMKRYLVYRLIKGSANAVYPHHAHEGVSLQDPEQSNDMACGIKEVLKTLESQDDASFISPQDKMFTCPLRVDFARLCWFSEMPEQRSKALSMLYGTFLLVGDDPLVEKNAIHLFNAILHTMPQYKSTQDIHSTLLLIQRVHESGSIEFVDHVAILRFLMNVSIESESKNKNQEDEEFFKKIAVSLLFYINENVKGVLSRSIEDSKIKSNEKNLIKWGVNRLYDSELLWGYDLAAWCLQNPYISVYLGEGEIKKLKEYKDSLRGGCKVIIKVMHAWDDVKRCKDAVILPFSRCIYLRSQGLKDQFQIQSGERKALEKTLWKTVKVIIQVNHLVIIIGYVALMILKVYNRNR